MTISTKTEHVLAYNMSVQCLISVHVMSEIRMLCEVTWGGKRTGKLNHWRVEVFIFTAVLLMHY